MKKYILLFLTVFLLASPPVFAANINQNTTKKEIIDEIKRIKSEVRDEVSKNKEVTNPGQLRQEIRDQVQKEIKEKKQSLLDEIKNKIKSFRFSARITGTIKEIKDNVLTVTAGDKDYQVIIGDKTNFNARSLKSQGFFNTILRRKFWGEANLSEFAVGDKVNVIGEWANEEKTKINAHLIRNQSIQKRWGAFIGEVTTAPNEGTFKMKTVNRGIITVSFGSSTKAVSRDEKEIKIDDVAVGHRVRVKGVWDNKTNTITDVSQIKDFSLPVKTSVTPASTESAEPTETPTPTPTTTD